MHKNKKFRISIQRMCETCSEEAHQEYFIQHITSMLEKSSVLPFCEIDTKPAPSGFFCLRVITYLNQETLQTRDLLTALVPHEISYTSFSYHRIFFNASHMPRQSLLYLELQASIEDVDTYQQLLNQKEQLYDNILFAFEHPLLAHYLATTPWKHMAQLLEKDEERHILYKNKKEQQLFIDDCQRFLLSIPETFTNSRTQKHLLNCVINHHLQRRKLSLHDQRYNKPLFFTVFPTLLHSSFSPRDVLSLVISIKDLSSYEHFDQRHIIHACEHCIPGLEVVSNSFYSYKYTQESITTFYLEIIKKEGHKFSDHEIALLKKDLEQELFSSVEQVITKVDIPPNDDDVLRNILLLSQAIRNSNSPVQTIIQFYDQSTTYVDFHVSIVRVLKHKNMKLDLSTGQAEIQCIPLTTSILDKVRSYSKESRTMLMRCQKEAFLRSDLSVDFLKARESVRKALEKMFGKLRDLNGGLIYQHNRVLEQIHSWLTKEETKEKGFIDMLFQSLEPSTIKTLLSAEHIITIFRMLRTLRIHVARQIYKPYLIEEYEQESFFACVTTNLLTKEDVLTIKKELELSCDDLAICPVQENDMLFLLTICLNPNAKIRTLFIQRIQELFLERQHEYQASSTLRLCMPQSSFELDPRQSLDLASHSIVKILYEGLMRLNQQGVPTHALAEEVRISDDGRIYTFRLKPTLWSNGMAVSARDFEYAWKSMLDSSRQTTFHHLFYPIKNAMLVKEGKLPVQALGVKALSSSMLLVELEQPTPYFLELCCLWTYSPLCSEIDKQQVDQTYRKNVIYVNNGPFTLSSSGEAGSARLVKNKAYWNSDQIKIDAIDITFSNNIGESIKWFDEGALDWIGQPFSSTPANIFTKKGLKLQSQHLSTMQWIFLNTRKKLFQSYKIRQAFSMALDRQFIIQQCLSGDEIAAAGALPLSVSQLHTTESLVYMPSVAKKLFEEGLMELEVTASTMHFIKMAVRDDETEKAVAQMAVAFWEKTFGINIILDNLHPAEFFRKASDSSYDIISTSWHSWFLDPLYSLEILKQENNPMNFAHWSNKRFASLLDATSQENKKEVRKYLIQEAETILLKEMPIIPIYEYSAHYVQNPALKHVFFSHTGTVDFTGAEIHFATRHHQSHAESPTDIRLYLQSDPTSFHPHAEEKRFSRTLLSLLFDGLTYIAEDGSVRLSLAESVSISDDGCCYTFHLRQSFWSNGDPITSHDFAYAWKEIIELKRLVVASMMHIIKNVEKQQAGLCSIDEVGISCPDEYTIQILLEHPAQYFLELLSNPFFSPMHSKVHGYSNIYDSVFNGAFIIKEYIPRSHLILVKNPFFWNKSSIPTETLTFFIIESAQTAYSLFKAGEIDWYGDPFGFWADEIDPPDISSLNHSSVLWLLCQTSKTPFSSKKIRQALSLAINKESLCTILHSNDKPAFTPLSPQSSLIKPSDQPFLIKQAQKLFDEGLLELGLTKETLPPIVISYWDDPISKSLTKAIQQQMQQIFSIEVEISLREIRTHLHKILAGEFQISLGRWTSWIIDPIYTLLYLSREDNPTSWSPHKYREAITNAENSLDATKRNQYLCQAESILLEELPLIPLLYKAYPYIKSDSLSGDYWTATGKPCLQYIYKTVPNPTPPIEK